MWLLALVKWWKYLHTTVTKLRHTLHSTNTETTFCEGHLTHRTSYIHHQMSKVAQMSSSAAYSALHHFWALWFLFSTIFPLPITLHQPWSWIWRAWPFNFCCTVPTIPYHSLCGTVFFHTFLCPPPFATMESQPHNGTSITKCEEGLYNCWCNRE